MTRLIRTNSDNPDFLKLTDKLDDELCLIYNTKKEDYEEYNRITDLDTVVLVYVNEELAGCGCFKKWDQSTAELKRMYVEPAFRGKGLAAMMVAELESWATEKGYLSVILETGNEQVGAVSLYHKLGYTDTDYFRHDDEETARSICMKKQLSIS